MRLSNQASRLEFIASTPFLRAASHFGVAEVAANEAGKLALNGGWKAAGPARA